jgi:prepilin-type N-terminal cleavage/methylation domain-containing protein
MTAAIRNRLADEGGFTLVELLVTMLIGSVVFGAAMGLTEVSGRSTSRTTDRVETAQRARLVMDRMVRPLRSMVCLDSSTYPIVSGDGTSVTFYVDFDNNPVYKPQKRRLTYVSTGTGKITEDQWDTTTTTGPPWTFPTTASRSATLATDVGQIGSTPVFRYFNPAGAQLTAPLSTAVTSPLATNSIARVSLVEVAFQMKPSNGNTDTLRRADRDTRVTVRAQTADTTDSDPNRLVCG